MIRRLRRDPPITQITQITDKVNLCDLRGLWIAAFLLALLLWASFFPLNFGWLGWVAVVPLLALVSCANGKGVYLFAWLGGLMFAVPALQWIRLASLPMYATWAGLSIFISLHFLLFAVIIRPPTRTARLPLLVMAPAVWVALEYARAHVGIGFAWYYLGHTQHEFLLLIQMADVAGAYGVSFLVMMANVVLFQWLQWYLDRRTSRPPMLGSVVVAGLTASALVYGWWRLGQNEFEPGPTLALLQGNLPQDIRDDPDEAETTREHFRRLAREAIRARPDLVVWSETSYVLSPTPLSDDLASLGTAAHLLGINVAVQDGERNRLYNSALLFDGGVTPIDRYDKMYRVPFGEYVPWEETLPFMRWFTPYENDYGIQAGERLTVFPVPGRPGRPERRNAQAYRFAVLICYEDTVPHLAREFLRNPAGGEPPDFFVNQSNDGWFKGSEEHEQHLVAARFRAVECRRAVARAVNMGVSGVIDGNGRLVALPGPTLSGSKAREAVVVADIPIDRRDSLYVRWGDILPVGCCLLVGVGLVVAALQWWRGE